MDDVELSEAELDERVKELQRELYVLNTALEGVEVSEARIADSLDALRRQHATVRYLGFALAVATLAIVGLVCLLLLRK